MGEGEQCDSTTVVTTTSERTVEGIFQLMINHRISGVPVAAGDGWPVGMVTKTDLSQRVEIGVRSIEGHTIVGSLYPVL
jgi:CBS domain-containing protein